MPDPIIRQVPDMPLDADDGEVRRAVISEQEYVETLTSSLDNAMQALEDVRALRWWQRHRTRKIVNDAIYRQIALMEAMCERNEVKE